MWETLKGYYEKSKAFCVQQYAAASEWVGGCKKAFQTMFGGVIGFFSGLLVVQIVGLIVAKVIGFVAGIISFVFLVVAAVVTAIAGILGFVFSPTGILFTLGGTILYWLITSHEWPEEIQLKIDEASAKVLAGVHSLKGKKLAADPV